jgi:transglutaminase-like putative cysteine protease
MSAAPRGRWARLALQLSRDKADTLLLLVSALLVLAPHASHLPLWVSALCGATLLWRGAITLRGKRMPPGALLLMVAVAAMAGVFYTYRTLLGRDAGVAMLVLLVAFKMLEMHARRDLFVVIFLCFFLVLTNFFYSQSIATALMMIASIIALLTAQLSFQFTGAVPPLRRRLLLGARIFVLAAPLALVLFLVFPRIQGPLWGMPGDATSGRSGLSNSMAPGNLSRLAQSDEPAFRVKFLDPAPPQAQLYWRGVVLGAFDGRTWTQVRPQVRPRSGPGSISIAMRGEPIRHQVTLEPSANRWLFALEMPQQLPRIAGNPSSVSAELEITAAYPIDQRVRYEVASYVDFSTQADAQLPDAAQWLALPRGFNPRAVQAGSALRQEPDPVKRITAVLGQFAREQYVYTLEPPLLGADSVDEFLFRTKAGFCEHYAGAFVFLMRAAGIPARVVTGYQGGETNPVDGFLTVRQSDAHAWAEVWLAGRGWIRVDPTAAVAPERIQRSLAGALPPKPPFGIEGLGKLINFETGTSSWIAQLRFQWSALNNGWNQWVLNYNPERQRGLLAKLQSVLMNWSTLAGLAAMVGLVILVRILRSRNKADPVDALYWALCLQLGRLGLTRAPDEGPSAYARRLARLDLAPEKKAAATRFLRLYSAHKYGAQLADAKLVATLKSLLTQSR